MSKQINPPSIEETIIDGISQRLTSVFGLKQPAMEVPTSDIKHLFKDIQAKEGKQPLFPMVAFSLSSMTLAEWSNPVAASIQGQYISVSRSRDTVSNIQLLPTQFTFDLTLLDNKRSSVLAFLSKWLMCAVNGSLSFEINLQGNIIPIQVTPERTASVPKKDMSVDDATVYEFTASFTVNGFISGSYDEAVEVPTLKNTELLGVVPDAPKHVQEGSQLDLKARLQNVSDRYARYSEEGSKGSIVFKLKG